MAEDKKDAEAALDFFVEAHGVKYDKAVGKLLKDRDVLLTFYGSPTVLASNRPPDSLPPAADRRELPAEHWKHIPTSNPIESTFATVRHRTKKSKGCLSGGVAKLVEICR